MVEIFAIIRLCIINKRNAKENGRKGWVYVLLTILLWVSMELLGGIIGAIIDIYIFGNFDDISWLVYVPAIIFAIGGGFISYFIAKRPNNTIENM